MRDAGVDAHLAAGVRAVPRLARVADDRLVDLARARRSARRSASTAASVPSSTAVVSANEPRNFPTGVRAPSRMTAVSMRASLAAALGLPGAVGRARRAAPSSAAARLREHPARWPRRRRRARDGRARRRRSRGPGGARASRAPRPARRRVHAGRGARAGLPACAAIACPRQRTAVEPQPDAVVRLELERAGSDEPARRAGRARAPPRARGAGRARGRPPRTAPVRRGRPSCASSAARSASGARRPATRLLGRARRSARGPRVRRTARGSAPCRPARTARSACAARIAVVQRRIGTTSSRASFARRARGASCRTDRGRRIRRRAWPRGRASARG